MSEEKKAIVQKLGFGGLMHIPPMNLPHKLLKELAYSFDVVTNILDTRYGVLTINPENIRVVLGFNASGNLFPKKVNLKSFLRRKKKFIEVIVL
ncbi:hypothetical protein AHAS_Ahas20G0144700 [Arachis hypogaea]